MMSSARKLLFFRLAAKADIDARQELLCLLHLQHSLLFSAPSSQQETQTLSRVFNTYNYISSNSIFNTFGLNFTFGGRQAVHWSSAGPEQAPQDAWQLSHDEVAVL